MITKPAWPDEHTAKLRECLSKHMSFAEATRVINGEFRTSYTRNALIGKAGRLGLCEKRGSRPKAIKQPSPARSTPFRAPRPVTPPPATRLTAPVCAPICTPVSSVESGGFTLIDLPPGGCRYPFGDGPALRFCGGAQHPGHSYCRGHLQIVLSAEGRELWLKKERMRA